MKKLVLIIIVACISISSFAFNTNTLKAPKNEKLRNEITNILQSATLNFESGFVKAIVTFTVTPKGEIIVLAVDSDNKDIEHYLRGKLNYKKVSFKAKKHGVVFKMPLKIVKAK